MIMTLLMISSFRNRKPIVIEERRKQLPILVVCRGMRSGSSDEVPGEATVTLPLFTTGGLDGQPLFNRPFAVGGIVLEAVEAADLADLDVCTLMRTTISPARIRSVDTRPTIMPMRKWGLPWDSWVDVSKREGREIRQAHVCCYVVVLKKLFSLLHFMKIAHKLSLPSLAFFVPYTA